VVHVTPQCRLRLSANSTVKRSDHEFSSNAPRALRAGFEKNTPLASGARPDAAQAKIGVSYAAALANNAHDHSVKGNFTWRF
jgi:hypothetical protein